MRIKFEYVENIKAIATIMVVLLHSYSVLCYQIGSASTLDWSIAVMYVSFMRPAVPLFLILSGITLLSKDYTVKDWVINKIFLRILVPYCFYATFYWHEGASFFEPISICYHFPFVATILTLYLIYPLCRVFLNNSTQNFSWVIYFCILWAIAIFLLNFYPKFSLFSYQEIYLFVGYPVIGYLIHFVVRNECKLSSRYTLYIYLFVSLATFILTYYLSYKSGVLAIRYFEYLSVNVVVMSFSLFIFFKNVNFSFIRRWRLLRKVKEFISQHSYGIFFIHPIFLEKFYYLHVKIPIIISGLVISILGLFLSCVSIYVPIAATKKFPRVNAFVRAVLG